MGKSGYLPNISGDFAYFKNYALNCLSSKNWNGASLGLDKLNRCLGNDYFVIDSTDLYNEKLTNETVYSCNHCTMEYEKIVNKGEEQEHTKTMTIQNRIATSRIKIVTLVLPLIDSIIQKQKYEKVWFCPECKEENKMNETTESISELQKPYSLKVVYEHPIMDMGISTRQDFENEFNLWFDIKMGEIMSQEVLYRIEWSKQNDGQEMEDTYKDSGDSKE